MIREIVRTGTRPVVRFLAGVGLLFITVTVSPLVKWWAMALAEPWEQPRGEVMVILGGSTLEDGIIGASSYWRSVYAVRAFQEGGVQRVIVAGGGSFETPISKPIRDFIACSGVPVELIEIETKSKSTRENALFLKEKLAELPGRKVLLTSDYHMFRASRVFRKAGMEVLPRPFPDGAKAANCWYCRWAVFVTLVTESMKIAYYYARGWI
ncbi:MAG: YdcF family protein [Bryobacteraceae bacterium]